MKDQNTRRNTVRSFAYVTGRSYPPWRPVHNLGTSIVVQIALPRPGSDNETNQPLPDGRTQCFHSGFSQTSLRNAGSAVLSRILVLRGLNERIAAAAQR